MTNCVCRLSALIALALLALPAFAQRSGGAPDANRLLDEVLAANRTLKYRGLRIVTFYFVREGVKNERQVTELIVRDGAKSRTEYSGDDETTGQIAVDDGTTRFQYKPKENAIHRMPSLQNETGGRLEQILRERRREFIVRVAPGSMVADHPTFMIELQGKEGVVHRLWVERKGKAILKREISGPNTDRGMAYEFQTFQYLRTVPNSEFVIDKPGARIVDPMSRLLDDARKLGVVAYRLAPKSGFDLFDARGFTVDSKVILRSTYGNGRVVVTLVQVKGDLDRKRLFERQDRRINVHLWRDGVYNLAILGDLPQDDLSRLAGLVGA